MISKLINETTLKGDQILTNEPMRNHTSFKIGGEADFVIFPKSNDEVVSCVSFCKQNDYPFYVIGNGSNLLVSDNGARGAVIMLSERLNNISVNENIINAEAGVLLSALSNAAYNNSLAGFEFLSGIPGTVGGGVFMNTGAYDFEIKDIIKEALVFTKEGILKTTGKNDLKLSYRKSIIEETKDIILSATFEGITGNKEDIKARVLELNRIRREKQPIEFPSAGSTFKRPKGYFAGKLISDCGLKGYQIGGAKVSEKHCGFIINTGTATAKDVLDLISHIKSVVYEKLGVSLEPEIKLLGEIHLTQQK